MEAGGGAGKWTWPAATQALGVGMEQGAVLLTLLENKNTISFSNCCLLPLESMWIINELPIKKITCEREVPGQSGSRVKTKLKDASLPHPHLPAFVDRMGTVGRSR